MPVIQTSIVEKQRSFGNKVCLHIISISKCCKLNPSDVVKRELCLFKTFENMQQHLVSVIENVPEFMNDPVMV